MTTVAIAPEQVEQVVNSGNHYGSTDASRRAYRIGDDVVVKVPSSWQMDYDASQEIANYTRLKEWLAVRDTYDGIRFGLPSFMESMNIPERGDVVITEFIEGSSEDENKSCCDSHDWYEAGEPCSDHCKIAVRKAADKHLGLTDMHPANYIWRDGVCVLIDLEN